MWHLTKPKSNNKIQKARKSQAGLKFYFAILVREEGSFFSESTLRIQKSKFLREISSNRGTRSKCFGQQAYTSLDKKELQYLQENKTLCESNYHNTSIINSLKPS